MTKKITQWGIIGALVAALGWDIFVATNPISGDTISEVILNFSRDNPTVIAAVFFLAGHLFWGQKVKDNAKNQ